MFSVFIMYHGVLRNQSSMQVRELAAASVQYCKQAGGKVSAGKDLVVRLSGIGTKGKHLQNCERDLHFAVNSFAKSMKVSVLQGPCRMWDPAQNTIVHTKLWFLDPVSMAEAFWRKGQRTFTKIFFGSMSEDDVMRYWLNTADHCTWFQKHAASSGDRRHWGRLAPLSLYGDDVNNYRNTEAGNISIVAWCSDLSRGNNPFLRYLLLSLYSEYTASEHTYQDLMDA